MCNVYTLVARFTAGDIAREEEALDGPRALVFAPRARLCGFFLRPREREREQQAICLGVVRAPEDGCRDRELRGFLC